MNLVEDCFEGIDFAFYLLLDKQKSRLQMAHAFYDVFIRLDFKFSLKRIGSNQPEEISSLAAGRYAEFFK